MKKNYLLFYVLSLVTICSMADNRTDSIVGSVSTASALMVEMDTLYLGEVSKSSISICKSIYIKNCSKEAITFGKVVCSRNIVAATTPRLEENQVGNVMLVFHLDKEPIGKMNKSIEISDHSGQILKTIYVVGKVTK